MNATKKVITYRANPYNNKKDSGKKGKIFNSTGRIVKNDYLKYDITSQRGTNLG